MTWLITEDGLVRELVNQSNSVQGEYLEFKNEINHFSKERGLPLMLPQALNSKQLTLSDLWGRFSTPITTASTEYGAEAAIVLRLSNSSLLDKSQETVACSMCQKNNFAIDWSFISDTYNKSSLVFGNRIEGTEPSQLIRKALKEITAKIYDAYASKTTDKQALTINVANINDLTEYSRVKTFLESLTSVVSVTLDTVNGSERFFKLTIIGSPETFLHTLKLNKALQQYVNPLDNESKVPVFYWRKV